MINRLVVAGDSFTYGEELDNRENDCWAAQLASMLNIPNVENLAKPGSGNKLIVRSIVEQVCCGIPPDLVIIGWTSPGRMEFADHRGIYDIWPGYSGAGLWNTGQDWRLEQLNFINKYHDPKYLYNQYLIDIILLQSFLKQKNIKYLMMTTVANEFYHRTFMHQMHPLVEQVDSTYYVGWPTAGMAEWTQGCKKGPNKHFLEDGHKRVAEKLNEYIRNIGWVS